MLSIEAARRIIIESAWPLPAEQAGLEALPGRIAAEDIHAAISQPPFDASAMDGYAVRFEDVAAPGARLKIIGEIAAGAGASITVRSGEAARIFTGGALPAGADHIVIQEDAAREGDEIVIQETQSSPRHIRRAGIDFLAGDRLARKGARLNDIHASLFAAANLPEVAVRQRPRIAFFANGDELVEPGAALGPGQIVNSTRYALANFVVRWGGEAIYAGLARDTVDDVKSLFKAAGGAHVIVPLGGASVGDYDFVKRAFTELGGEMKFENVAVKPGKPAWFGALGGAHVLGLPGNPASGLVCAVAFLKPLIDAMLDLEPRPALPVRRARLTAPLEGNGARAALLRARILPDTDGILCAHPHDKQDSALLSPFVASTGLIFRQAGARALNAGDDCAVVLFDDRL